MSDAIKRAAELLRAHAQMVRDSETNLSGPRRGEITDPKAREEVAEHERLAAELETASKSETTTLKYTDAIVDAPRQLLAYAETPGRTLEGLRIYLRQCGVKFERCWPDWAYENGHLTKGGLAELVHRMMEDVRHG